MTTLANYQARAAATAQPAAYAYEYLVPMIVGEVGELFGQRAKAVWHGWDVDRLTTELVSEFGDVCWGTAILLEMEGVRSISGDVLLPGRSLWGAELDPWQTLLQKATNLHMLYVGGDSRKHLQGQAQQMWMTLEKTCGRITGRTFDQVLDANIAKLASRAARGTLVGSGDHR